MRKLALRRWVTIAVMAAGLVGLTATSASAGVNYSPEVPVGSQIVGPGCGDTNSWGYWLADGTWDPTYGADYAGPDAYQDSYDAKAGCNGRSFNTLTTTTQTGTFWWGFHIDAQATQTCQIYASIPGDHAGDYDARYDFWSDNGSWLGWPGETINQQPLSGWIQIGIDLTVPAGTHYLIVSLSNASATPDRWAGAGAMAFSCE